jgi:hypothetical protein
MPGSFLLGSRYYQEQAPDDAEDRGENARMGFAVSVPAGIFTECVQIDETNPLSSNPNAVDVKVFCPGVGIVKDESLELVSFGVAH